MAYWLNFNDDIPAMTIDVGLEILLLLFVIGAVAGWVDTIAGGGGLITTPALLLTGAPPAAVVATNKLQGAFGTFTATFYFIRQDLLPIRSNLWTVVTVCIASILGGIVLTWIDATYLSYFMPILLIILGLYFLFFATDLDKPRPARMSQKQYASTVAPALGFYDGFFGPGTGSFMAMSLVTLRGLPIKDATVHAKLFNLSSNVASLVYFIFFGNIIWPLGFAMVGGANHRRPTGC